jgi:predicted protein tyrosine phosphatase
VAKPRWADAVFVMERRLHRLLLRHFSAALEKKELVCLGVADNYRFMQPELVEVLARKLTPHLGEPADAGGRG